jgi:pimeloyl-ACP methyl ester carboxylesterase
MTYARVNGTKTYYHSKGDGQTVILLHGGGQDHQVLTEQLSSLTDRYNLVTYDLRKHGKTEEIESEPLTTELLADDLFELIRTLDITDPVVFGHSLGGMALYAFADKYPDCAAGIITCGSRTCETFTMSETLYVSFLLRALPLLANEKFNNVVETVIGYITGADENAADATRVEEIRTQHSCEDAQDKSAAPILRSFKQYYTSEWDYDITGVPVLTLYGESEPWFENHCEFLSEESETHTSEMISESSHSPHISNSEELEENIREFCQRVIED